jgi:hypothetical protein
MYPVPLDLLSGCKSYLKWIWDGVGYNDNHFFVVDK